MSSGYTRPNSPMASQFLSRALGPYRGARNPVTHSGRGFRAKFASKKNQRMVRCESLLELDFVRSAEFARNVIRYEEQPVTIDYRLDGRPRRYTPDFLLTWRDGTRWYVEVKPSELLAMEKNQEKFLAITEFFKDRGQRFITIDEKQIRHPVRLPQIKELLRLRSPSALNLITDLEEIVLPADATFGSIAADMGEDVASSALTYRLVVFDLTARLNAATPISVYEENDDGALLI